MTKPLWRDIRQQDSGPSGNWAQVPVPTATYPLLAADFVSEDDGWAVGILPYILRWDGSSWRTYPIPETARETLQAIDLVSHDEGWAVGVKGTTLHWDGQDWTLVNSPTDSDLFAVTILSPTLGWAVGGSPGDPVKNLAPDTVVIQWNGTIWRRISSPAGYPLEAIAMLSAEEGWAAGYDTILRWDGKGWQQYSIPQLSGVFYHSIAISDVNDAWIVGEKVNAKGTNEGIILHWNGAEWADFQRVRLGLFSVAMISKSFGWAVGGGGIAFADGGSVILRWDGQTWAEYPSPTALSLQFVWAHDVHDGWILAGGKSGNADFQSAVYRYGLQPTATPTETGTAIPTITPATTVTPNPPRPISSIPTSTLTSIPKGEVNGPSQYIVGWLFVIGLLTVAVGGAVFILRRRHKV
jgi:hypothetical protein